LQALFGRNGESPVVVVAASTPSNCFHYAFVASKIALEHMTPVILMTDGFLANSSEPWKIPKMSDYPEIVPPLVKAGTENWQPYDRDIEKLCRGWAIPGTKGLEHRIGGLEKDFVKGSVSHDPVNHEKMVRVREDKVQKVADYIPELEVHGEEKGDLLVVGWGGTFGHLLTAVRKLQKENKKISLVHIHYIKPLPNNIAAVFENFRHIVVCEHNLGQMAAYLRMTLQQFQYHQLNKVQGIPFTMVELDNCFNSLLEKK
jgi:2-oxoglutarate ferredoxin oxidoreductase subunit alpha